MIDENNARSLTRRELLASAGSVASGAILLVGKEIRANENEPSHLRDGFKSSTAICEEYSGDRLDRVAFPMGGMGAGMICLEGTGALSHVSVRNHPDLGNEPCAFAAISIKGPRRIARVLEGPVPGWKRFGRIGGGLGAGGSTYGLPRFASARFQSHFPFGKVTLADKDVPLTVEITGWSPFEPGDPDNASLPAVALEYHFINKSSAKLDAVFSWNARNFMAIEGHPQAVKATSAGFVL